MRTNAYWTIGGDFIIGDADDEDAPLVTVTIHDAIWRELARANSAEFAASLAAAIKLAPHPFADTAAEREEEGR